MNALPESLDVRLSAPKGIAEGYAVATGEVTADEIRIRQQAAEIRRQKAAMADEVLFERIAVGRQEDAFSELYDRYSSRVYGLLLHMLRTEEDAQDLLQDVFVTVWQKAPSYIESRGNVSSWVMSLARNRAVDELRSRQYKDRGQESQLVLSEERPDLQRVIADHRLPDRDLHAADAQREVRQAISELTHDQQATIDLAYFGGLSHQEISDKLQMPMGTVKTRIRQGVMILGKKLKPHFG